MRLDPDSEANRQATRQSRREEFALVMATLHTAKDLLEQSEIIQRAQWLVRQQQLDDVQFGTEQRWEKEITGKAK